MRHASDLLRRARRQAVRLKAYTKRMRTRAVCDTVTPMNALDGRLVVVNARHLDDLLEMARLAVDRLPDTDPLASHLRGAVAQVRLGAVLEPDV